MVIKERMRMARDYRKGYYSLIKRIMAAYPRPDYSENGIWECINKLINENKYRLSISLDKGDNWITFRDPNRKYSTSTRMTLQKFFTRKLGCNDAIPKIDGFVHRVIAGMGCDYTVHTVNGEHITKAYANGVGYDTCMTDDCAHFTLMYEENPDKVEMAIYNDDEGGVGRALVWTTDEGIKILDRIYPDYPKIVANMRFWALQRDWIIRVRNGYPESGYNVDVSDYQTHKITVKTASNGKIPYLDTFTYVKQYNPDIRHAVLTNGCGNYMFMATRTDGHAEGYEVCYNCGEHREDMREHDNELWCDECFFEDHRICDRCGCTTDAADSMYSEITDLTYCENCYDRTSTHCVNCDTDILRDDAVTVTTDSGDVDMCSECASEYHECNDCKGRFDSLTEVYGVNGEARDVCDRCLKIYYRECADCGDNHIILNPVSSGDRSVCNGCLENYREAA
jgi:hypothetical protein